MSIDDSPDETVLSVSGRNRDWIGPRWLSEPSFWQNSLTRSYLIASSPLLSPQMPIYDAIVNDPVNSPESLEPEKSPSSLAERGSEHDIVRSETELRLLMPAARVEVKI